VSREPNETLEVLRGIWSAQGQSGADLDEGATKSCKRMADVGFGELADGGDGDVRAAWRDRLEREGKLNPGNSLADLMLGPAEPGQ
jgi:hypothetical protein